LLKNIESFQGKNKLNSSTNYFEGWYFKHFKGDSGLAFIPGINIQNGKKHAFIQVITKSNSYYINYSFNEFKFMHSPFSVQIGNSFFSKEKMILDINNKTQNIKINGSLYYSNLQEIKKTFLLPNIMGPFSYLPFMECNHAIISMKHNIMGNLTINGALFSFDNGIRIYRKGLGNFFS